MAKIAIVCASGGALNAFSVAFLAHARLKPHWFDLFLGCSSGFSVLACFLTEQTPIAKRVWLRELVAPELIRPRNMLKTRGYPADIDYLVDHGLRDLRIEQTLQETDADLRGCVVRRRDAAVLYPRATPENVRTLMKATKAMPRACRPVRFDGELMLDGGTLVSNPVREAHRLGYRRILVLENNPPHVGPPWWEVPLAPLLFPLARQVRRAFPRRRREFEQAWEFMNAPPEGTEILVVHAKGRLPATPTTRDPEAIRYAFDLGRDAAGRKGSEVHATLERWKRDP